MHRRSLRVRLLAIVLLGIIAIAGVQALVGVWGLNRVRDLAIDDSTQALQQQAGAYLQTVAREQATTTDETLKTTQRLAEALARYLAQTPASAPASAAPTLLTAEDGRRYYHDKTTILLPADGDAQVMFDELAASQGLNGLLPDLAKSLTEIARISYMAPSGFLRTFPNLTPLPKDWTVQSDLAYQAGQPAKNPLHKVVWTDLHRAIDTPAQSVMVISAVAPIYQDGVFKGAVIVDLKRDRLTEGLGRLGVEQAGFAFLIDRQGQMIATSEEGQSVLLRSVSQTAEQGPTMLDQIHPALAPMLTNMRDGHSDVDLVELGGRMYLVAYAPVSALGWSLAIAVPVREVTASTDTMSARIADIARGTGQFGLLSSIVAVVLLGLILSLVLRRQIILPLTTLVSATESIGAGEMRSIPVAHDDEIGQLARSFNVMTESLAASRAELTAANQQLELKVRERTADLDKAVAKLEQSFATQQELLRTLREVSTPVVPVVEGVLAMPLVGQIDEERSRHMIGALLSRIERDRARTVLLDITGVPVIDTAVAQSLLQMVAASRLLGAEVVLVGVAPEVAQTIVTLGIDLRGLRTAADLRSAVEELLVARRNHQHR
jgi:anti-anti-sigma regulatory factor/HAMP domain-containing protein